MTGLLEWGVFPLLTLLGGQLGARLSQRLSGRSISLVLVAGLVLIGIRLAIHAFEH